MSQAKLKYVALWIFLAGVVIIVFMQFISRQNINRLTQGNKRLLDEVKVQNNLQELEADLLTLESDIRGVVITNNTAQLTDVHRKIRHIGSNLATLENLLQDHTLSAEVSNLRFLVRKKISFSYQILDAYNNGKEKGEAVINTGRGKLLQDSINNVIAGLDRFRQANLNKIVSSIERNGSSARSSGFILAALACITCVFAFLYLVNMSREQQKMILMLNESEKKIKDIAEIREQFLANMSHEIRTPLNAILGFTNLLKKTALNAQQTDFVSFIHSSGENLLTLINDILDISKIEAGMMHIEKAPFHLDSLISPIETMFREKAKQKSLDFTVKIAPETQDVLSGDAIRLTQILINLLSNAIKFTEQGFVVLEVKPVSIKEEITWLSFAVCDSGIGIAQDKRNQIFDRFQQAEAETTRRFGGTGLGLSIVKQLVNLLQGNIEVKSELGKGSQFIITLPFKTEAASCEPFGKGASEIELTVNDVRILIAEDNKLNQQLIRHLMKQWKLEYMMVNNGKEVIRLLQQDASFSLILMDIQMPEMDGYQTTGAIRDELKLPVPIVAMTAYAMAGEKERCINYGMNGYISKPIKEADLYTLIKQYAICKQGRGGKKSLINLVYLKELSGGDMVFEKDIIQQFIEQIPEELSQLKAAISEKNMQKLRSVAHGMKSSVSYLGLADELYPYLQVLEKAAIHNELNGHFAEDYTKIEHVCLLAVEEARQMTSA